MRANYGYTDGSGEWYISIDGNACDACGECIEVCPQQILAIVEDDYGNEVAAVREEYRNNIKFLCSTCRAAEKEHLCSSECTQGAISFSW